MQTFPFLTTFHIKLCCSGDFTQPNEIIVLKCVLPTTTTTTTTTEPPTTTETETEPPTTTTTLLNQPLVV